MGITRDTLMTLIEDMGYKYAFSWAKKGVLLEKYIETGYYKDESPSYELIMKF